MEKLDLFACPRTGERLVHDAAAGALVGRSHRYVIQDGILRLNPELE